MKASKVDESRGIAEAGARWLSVLAIALALAFSLGLFYPLLRGNVYLGSDLGAYHLPVRAFYSACLKEGLRFWWWPDAFCGYYLHGEGQAGMLHPLHLVLYRFLPLDWAFNVELVSGYLIAFGGMVALLRRWSLPWYAALFGAHCFAFSGFTLIHFMHLQAISVIGHLPWMLLASDVLRHSTCFPSVRRAWLGLALLAASQLLLGYPQYVLFTLLAIGLYGLMRLRGLAQRRRILYLLAALLTGLLIAGVQVVPTFDVLQSALRQDNAEGWRSGSLHPVNLLQLVGPYWFENHLAFGEPAHEYGLYAGVIPTVLSIWILLCSGPWGRDRSRMYFGAVLAVTALVLALGEYGGIYGIVARVPVLGAFRCSARHIVLVHFALAILAGLALARIPGGWGPVRSRGLYVLAALSWSTVLVVIVLNKTAPTPVGDALRDTWHGLCAGPLLVTLAVALILAARRYPHGVTALLMVFAAIDMASYGLPNVWNHAPQSSGLADLETVLREELPAGISAADTQAFRAHGNWRVGRLTQVGLSNFLGYVGLPPAWHLDISGDVAKRIAGVRWEKRPLHAPNWTVHEAALPRARMVSEVVVGDVSSGLLATLDPARVALVDHGVAVESGLPGTVVWKWDNPGDLEIEASTPQAGLLVLSERFHQGWEVRVDGEPARVVRVYGDFMGCLVPAGTHAVTFYFAPLSLRIGGMVSTVGLLLLVLTGCLLGPGRRPEGENVAPGRP